MLVEYFEIAGVLFVVYGAIRFIIWTELREASRTVPPFEPYDGPVKAIDTTVLSGRLQGVRRDYTVDKPAQSDSFKRALLVNSRQEEIARLAFFQKPPPEPPENESGWNALLV